MPPEIDPLYHLQSSSRGGSTALIWGASPQMRCERKKDRVEVNPELLAAASAQAEISFFFSLLSPSPLYFLRDRE
jgi:hypothetical protein